MCAGCEVLVEADDNNTLIVGTPQRILDQQLRLHTVHLLNIINSIKFSKNLGPFRPNTKVDSCAIKIANKIS